MTTIEIDTSGLDAAEIDSAFRQIGSGVPEHEVRAYMAMCRSLHLKADLDKLAAEVSADPIAGRTR